MSGQMLAPRPNDTGRYTYGKEAKSGKYINSNGIKLPSSKVTE